MAQHEVPLIQLSAYEDIAAIDDATRRYAGEKAANKTVDRILLGIELLASTPYLGPLHHDELLAKLGYRKLVLGNHIAVYRVDDGRATVLRVFLASSDYVSRIKTS